MARYKLTISCEFDDAYPLSAHTDEAQSIVNLCCPSDLGFCDDCVIDCRTCWQNALKEGVCADAAENVHVERVG